MDKAEIVTLIRIAVSTLAVFGFPYLLRMLKCQVKKKQCIYMASLFAYLICVALFAFVFRTEKNGTGIITDPFWAFRQLFETMASGYESGGIVEAINRIRWIRDTVAGLILNILFFVPFGYLIPCTFKWPRTWWRILLLSFLFSVGIEILQFVSHRGWLDIADPIYNCGGTMIGYNLYRRLLHET